jgi:hypothetical protein
MRQCAWRRDGISKAAARAPVASLDTVDNPAVQSLGRFFWTVLWHANNRVRHSLYTGAWISWDR